MEFRKSPQQLSEEAEHEGEHLLRRLHSGWGMQLALKKSRHIAREQCSEGRKET